MKLKVFLIVSLLGYALPTFGACPAPPNLDQWLQDHPNYSSLVLWEFQKTDLPENNSSSPSLRGGPQNPWSLLLNSPPQNAKSGSPGTASVWKFVQQNNGVPSSSHNLNFSTTASSLLVSTASGPVKTLRWLHWPESFKNQVRKYFSDYWNWNCQAWEFIEPDEKKISGEPVPGGEVAAADSLPFFNTLMDSDPNLTSYPPPPIVAPGYSGILIGPQDAFGLYAKNLAWRLVLEASGKLPYSMADLDTVGLQQLLDGRTLFRLVAEAGGYKVNTIDLIAPPLLVFSFLATQGILGKNRHDTIAGLLDWEDHLFHAALGGLKTEYSAWYIYYQYEGPVPISKILSGTHETTEAGEDPELKHWTLGCGVTSGFNQLVLNTVNIPVQVMEIPGDTHNSNCFPTEKLCTCHGDDPYQRRIYSEVPATALLIPENTFKMYFQNEKQPPVSLSYCWAQAKLKYLPKKLLKDYCSDGPTPHAEGEVFQHFKGFYTVQGLEVGGLWQNLEKKVEQLGGCEQSWKF